MMEKLVYHHLMFLLFFWFSMRGCRAQLSPARQFPVGLILDLGTPLGKTCEASVRMALDDFYRSNPHSAVRLELHTRDSRQDVVGAASAAADLLRNKEVRAIIGPMTSDQASFLVDLGGRCRVPILSFSATSPSLSRQRKPFFVRTAPNDSSQAKAIASIVRAFEWKEVVLIYEDTSYGAGVIPDFNNALQAVDARFAYQSVISAHSSGEDIREELHKLKAMETRVFVVHTSSSLGSRLFVMANQTGMMGKGYVWIITEGMTCLLDSLDPGVIQSMQGVLGLKPRVPESTALLDAFTHRWRTWFHQQYPGSGKAEPTMFDLWAYDTAWALAMAVDHVESSTSSSSTTTTHFRKAPAPSGNTSINLDALGIYQAGQRLLDLIMKTKFKGISGDFRLVDGQLQHPPSFQIVNVVGNGWRTVGFWSPPIGGGIAELKPVLWPGDSTSVPKGRERPTLRVGVPAGVGFTQFVDVSGTGASTKVTGYSIDVFDAVVESLSYATSYTYIPFQVGEPGSNGYDDLVAQVYHQKLDAAVGDITITANRSLSVDFTLPYTSSGMSGVALIVPMKEDKNKNAWVFLKPLTADLWLGSMAFFVFTGFVVWVIEHRINKDFRGPPSQQMGTVFYFAFSTMVYAHRERVKSNLSKLVVTIWVFAVLILTSSYTASLTSMLTVQQLQPTVADVSALIKHGDPVGYQAGSFLKGLLMWLGFHESKLKPYVNTTDYADALSRGSRNGGVAAIFDEIPYIKIFLEEHCSGFTMVSPTYRTDGFGFVFPRGSPLARDISRAILDMTQNGKLDMIERKWFGDQTSCTEKIDSNQLSFRSFWGLFLITGAVSTLALLIFLITFVYKNWDELGSMASSCSLWERIVDWARHYDQKTSC